MGSQILKTGIVKASGSGINPNILLNSATLPGKTSSIVYNNITTGVHTGTSSWNEAYWPCSISAANNPLSGQKITISLDFMCTDISKIASMYYGFGMWNSSNSRIGDMNIAVSQYTVINGIRENNKWCRMCYTLTVPTDWPTTGLTYRLQIKTNSSAEGATMYHKRIKIELGSAPTEWTISQNDYNLLENTGIIEKQNYTEQIFPAKIFSDSISASEFIEVY